MIEGHDIVCISSGYWDSPWITHQQVMKRLSQANRVLYVEPPLSYLPVRYPERWQKFAAFTEGVRQEADSLWITCCPPALPFKRVFNSINRLCQRMVLAWTRKATTSLDFADPILWVYLPTAVELIGKLGESFVLYHCIDEFTAVSWGSKSVIAGQEKRMLDLADLTVTCSEAVYEAKYSLTREIINVPNGVDFDHYHSAYDGSTTVPDDIKHYDKPVIGFSGVLDDRLDTEFLLNASKRYPDFTFVLVGPARRPFPELKDRHNIRLLGNRPLAELPGYIKGFDVCLIPYITNDFVKNISPTKLYEYLATGKPIVAPDIRALSNLRDCVHVGRDSAEMIDQIGLALEVNDEEKVRQRVDLARQNTWDHRIEAISSKLHELSIGEI